MMADLEEQFAAMTLDKYRLEVSRDDLKRCPLEVLNTLCNLFQTEKKTELQVTFIGEPSVDVGGPGQEFITTLVEEVCKALVPAKDESSLFRPYLRTLKPEHTKALEQLGALLLFCLHSSAKFVIGRQLDPALFVALNKLNKDLITTNFEDIDKTRFKELFAIFEAMYSINEDDQAAILRMKTYMQEDGVSLEPIIDAMRESLEPCFLLYKGMLSTPFSVDVLTEMPYQELEVALQGVLEPKLVVKKLNIRAENTPQEWVREWILGLTPTKMKRFLRLIAGTPALGKRMLNIEFSGQSVQFSTCTQTLTLPESSCTSKHSLFDMLEFSLKTEIKFNAK